MVRSCLLGAGPLGAPRLDADDGGSCRWRADRFPVRWSDALRTRPACLPLRPGVGGRWRRGWGGHARGLAARLSPVVRPCLLGAGPLGPPRLDADLVGSCRTRADRLPAPCSDALRTWSFSLTAGRGGGRRCGATLASPSGGLGWCQGCDRAAPCAGPSRSCRRWRRHDCRRPPTIHLVDLEQAAHHDHHATKDKPCSIRVEAGAGDSRHASPGAAARPVPREGPEAALPLAAPVTRPGLAFSWLGRAAAPVTRPGLAFSWLGRAAIRMRVGAGAGDSRHAPPVAAARPLPREGPEGSAQRQDPDVRAQRPCRHPRGAARTIVAGNRPPYQPRAEKAPEAILPSPLPPQPTVFAKARLYKQFG